MLLLLVFELGDVVFGFFFKRGVGDVAAAGENHPAEGVGLLHGVGVGGGVHFLLSDYVFDFRGVEHHLLSEVNLVVRHAKFVDVQAVERLYRVPEIVPERTVHVLVGCDVGGVGEQGCELVVIVGVFLVQHLELLLVFGEREVPEHVHVFRHEVFDLRGGGVHVFCKGDQLVGLVHFFERVVLEDSEHEEYGGH